jgi:tRNA C32,U32 (ribose-2'-O)-methylase TrmJ
MRSIRSVFLRADLDEREAAIWHGIFGEVLDAVDEDDGTDDVS